MLATMMAHCSDNHGTAFNKFRSYVPKLFCSLAPLAAEISAEVSANAQLGMPNLALEGIHSRQGVLLWEQMALEGVLHLHLVGPTMLMQQLTCAVQA